jgi:hypothetical protein
MSTSRPRESRRPKQPATSAIAKALTPKAANNEADLRQDVDWHAERAGLAADAVRPLPGRGSRP